MNSTASSCRPCWPSSSPSPARTARLLVHADGGLSPARAGVNAIPLHLWLRGGRSVGRSPQQWGLVGLLIFPSTPARIDALRSYRDSPTRSPASAAIAPPRPSPAAAAVPITVPRGCRAVAVHLHHDPQTPDPECPRVLPTGPSRARLRQLMCLPQRPSRDGDTPKKRLPVLA